LFPQVRRGSRSLLEELFRKLVPESRLGEFWRSVVRHWLDLFADMHYARRRRTIRLRNLMGFLTRGDAA
jgi:hypothetical protein